MIKAIFWDNDGILVDTEKLYFKANQVVFSELGINLTKELYVENFLKRSKGTWHLLREKGYSDDEISELREKRNGIYSDLLLTDLEVIDGVDEALQKIYRKVYMGIVTSSRRNHFETIHSQTGLLKYFNFTITSDDCSETKPSPKPYLDALEKSGFEKEECLIIEDSERGLKAAIAAGIKCYIIPTDLTKNSNFKGADKILNNISEIGSLF